MQTGKISSPPLWRLRLQAFLIDYVVICAYLLLLGLAVYWLANGPLRLSWPSMVETPAQRDRLAFMTAVLPVIIYFAVQEASVSGATLGKRRMRLRVVNLSGKRLGFGEALVRSAVKFLPWQIAHTCLFHIPGWPLDPQPAPGWVVAGFTLVWIIVLLYLVSLFAAPSRRTLYDRAARSQVVVRD
jgi:uncharacterized RDD family membrane protein YckC